MAIQHFSTVAELRLAIQQLEIKQANEWPPLKEQLLTMAESLKPRHILKGTIKEIFSAPDLKILAANSTVGLAAGLAANYFFPAKLANRLTKLITGAIVGVTSIRSFIRSGKRIKSIGNDLFEGVSNNHEIRNA